MVRVDGQVTKTEAQTCSVWQSNKISVVVVVIVFNVFQVTVLIYSDLLLLTKENEAGRCNVLQSPLYLNTLQLREGTLVVILLFLLMMSL